MAAAKEALARLEGLLALPGGAPRLLADRLTDRLVKTGGETLVVSPYGWLVGRGLMQRQSTGAATTAFGQPPAASARTAATCFTSAAPSAPGWLRTSTGSCPA